MDAHTPLKEVTYDSLPTETKSLGQGVSLAVQPVLLRLASCDAAGRREILLVAGASLSPSGRGNGSGGLVPSHIPDLSGKLVPVANGAYSARAGTNGDLSRTQYTRKWGSMLVNNFAHLVTLLVPWNGTGF